MLSKAHARQILEEILARYPEANTTIYYKGNFQLLSAVLLSAQATDVSVNKATPALFAAYPTPQDMAKATPEDIMPYIQTIGLYRRKANYLVEMAKKLLLDFDGKVPKDRKALESLPGVGRKTANVVRSVGFQIPDFAVDTHVARVSKHHHIVDSNANVREIEDRLKEVLPKEKWILAQQAMIAFGRELCTPRQPKCVNYPQFFIKE